jgi:hypothetical protein
MTVSSTTRKAGPFAGTGSAVSHPFAFKVFASTDVLVVRTTTVGDTTLTMNTDYAVTLNADQDANPGGSIALVTVLAVGESLTVSSRVPALQNTDLQSGGGWYPKTVEDALDRLTILQQQLALVQAGTVQLSITTPTGVSTMLPPPVANRLIGWGTDGTSLVNQDPASLVTDNTVAAEARIRADYASTDEGKGLSLIGLRDAAGKFTATNPEAALEELYDRVALRYADRFSPWDYGASATPGANNSPAIQACLNAAIASGKQARVSLWGDWSLAAPIVGVDMKNIMVEGGNFSLLAAFPDARYAFDFQATGDRKGDWNHFAYMKVDCAGATSASAVGGFRIQAGFKNTVFACQALHFKNSCGFWVQENFGSHEVMLESCWAMEFLYEDGAIAYTGPWTGTGFRVDPNDCKLNGCVSYFTGNPLVLDSQYNKVTNCHFGTGKVVLTASCSFCSLTDNYFDMCEVEVADPWHLKILNNEFLHATSSTSATFLKFKPSTAGTYVYGLQVRGNTFQNNIGVTMKSMDVDTSLGTFAVGGVGMCDIAQNSFVNTTRRTTRQRIRLFQGASTSYAVTADQFPFGVAQHVVATFAPAAAGVAVAQGVHVSGLTATMTLASAVSGVAHFELDCNVE